MTAEWTASKGGQQIAEAPTSADLIKAIRALGEDGRGAVVVHHVGAASIGHGRWELKQTPSEEALAWSEDDFAYLEVGDAAPAPPHKCDAHRAIKALCDQNEAQYGAVNAWTLTVNEVRRALHADGGGA